MRWRGRCRKEVKDVGVTIAFSEGSEVTELELVTCSSCIRLGVSTSDNSSLPPRPFDCTPLLVAKYLSQLIFSQNFLHYLQRFSFLLQTRSTSFTSLVFSTHGFSHLAIPPRHFQKMASNTLDLDFDASPPQSPLARPTRHTADEISITPKRKRDDESNGDGEHTTPAKRSSPPRQVLTPDTLDGSLSEVSLDRDNNSKTQHLTPMQRFTSSLQQATPTTIVKGVDRFRLDSGSSPKAADIEIYDPFVTADANSLALPPLVRPRMIHLTTAAKSKASSDLKSSASIPVIDLTSVHDDTYNKNDHASVPSNAVMEKQTTTTSTANKSSMDLPKPFSRSHPAAPAPPTKSALTTAIATTTRPEKPLSTLQSTPAIAPAYVPQYISSDSPVKLRDAKQFCLRPPFWKRWPRDKYERLATYIQSTVDLTPFAEQENLTIKEVQWVTYAVVFEPLLDEKEKLGEVAQKRMEGIFKAFNRDVGHMKWRVWMAGDEESGAGIRGDLCGVRPGVVQLVSEKAELIEVPFKKLGGADREYVLGLLTEGERKTLMGENVELLEVVPAWHISLVVVIIVGLTVFEQRLGTAAGERQDRSSTERELVKGDVDRPERVVV
jgi:hypothetical protein